MFFFDFDDFIAFFRDSIDSPSTVIEIFLALFYFHLFKNFFDFSCFILRTEVRAYSFSGQSSLSSLLWFIECSQRIHIDARRNNMSVQIIGRSISDTDAFHPTKPFTIQFSIPTFGCIVCKLISCMFSKSELLWINSCGKEENPV